MTRSSADLATEIAQRLLFGQLYPVRLCTVQAADYRYRTELLVTEYGEALVREQGALTADEQRRVAHLARAVARKRDAERAIAAQGLRSREVVPALTERQNFGLLGHSVESGTCSISADGEEEAV